MAASMINTMKQNSGSAMYIGRGSSTFTRHPRAAVRRVRLWGIGQVADHNNKYHYGTKNCWKPLKKPNHTARTCPKPALAQKCILFLNGHLSYDFKCQLCGKTLVAPKDVARHRNAFKRHKKAVHFNIRDYNCKSSHIFIPLTVRMI